MINQTRVDWEGWNLLHYGAYLNNQHYIQLFEKYRSEILAFSQKKKSCKFRIFSSVSQGDYYGNCPIHIACIYDSYEVIDQLLTLGHKYDECQYNHINLLLKQNQDGWIPLALTIIHNHVKCFQKLIHHTLTACGRANIAKYFQGFSMITLAVASLVTLFIC